MTNDAKQVVLLPCPFCGNPPKSGDGTYGYWLIFCSDENNCFAQPSVGHKTEAEAIAAWNTRQPQTDDNEDFGDTVLDFGVELLFAVIGLETEPHGTTAVFEVELRGRTRKVTVTCAKLEASRKAISK